MEVDPVKQRTAYSVAVPLYLPGKPEKIKISADKGNENVFTREYSLNESPVLTKDPSVVYTMYGIYEGKEEKIIVLLYDPSVLE